MKRSSNKGPRVILAATSLHYGDAETQLARLAFALRDAGYQVRILTVKSRGAVGKMLVREGFRLSDFVFGRTFISKIPYEFYKAELVISLDHGYALHSLASLRNMRVPRLKAPPYIVIFSQHGKPRRRERYPLRRARRIVYVAKSQRPYLAQTFKPDKLKYIHPGITIPDEIPSKAEAREKLGITGNETIVAAADKYIYLKGFDLLLKAFAKASADFPDTRLYLAGKGAQRRNLGNQTVNLGIADRVTFLGFMEDNADLYAAADLFVAPSRLETVPLSCLEAMAYGNGVLGFGVGDISGLLAKKRGVVADPASSDDMAERLGELLAEPGRIAEMGERGREYIRDKFSAQDSDAEYLRLVKRVIGKW
ncbi:MAG: glycosyltransferase family 4 protein [bacterium]|nr:glycosyltransferase family 4 protein [bacterium]